MARKNKKRLDELVIDAGLAEDKAAAQRLIMAGQVIAGEQKLDKPGTLIDAELPIRLKKQKATTWASRAGHKLEGALAHWQISPENQICLDLGASTGGFTDCLLAGGASRVYAVDVGTNQLLWRLRNHPDVVSLEQTHARDLTRELVPDPIALLVVDVSFTSLRYVLPAVLPLLAPVARGVLLFKPQFEAPRGDVGEGGLVGEDAADKAMAVMDAWLVENQIEVLGKIKSPVKGRDGNQEYLYYVQFP